MKIQGIAVMFAIIILPIVIILSYYIQYSIDTIARQTAYDTKLIDSTHDAMASFELNTANENLSSVSDSLRSIIDAATNVFFNTLSTNLGMSNANKSYVQNFIPAILYTLYDGYYIYSPTRVPEVLTAGDEQVIYVGDYGVTFKETYATATGEIIGKYNFDKAGYESGTGGTVSYESLPVSIKYEYGQMLYKNNDGTYSTITNNDTTYKQDYILKSYMPYSSRYVSGATDSKDFDLTINYTLDNYLTVEGYIDKVYFSKSGYFIGKDVIQSITVDGATDLLTYNQDRAEEICLSGQHTLTLKIKPFIEDGETRVSTPIEYIYTPWIQDGVALNSIQLQEKLDKLYETNSELALIQELEMKLSNLKAITYYVKAQIFSNWIYENLGTESAIKLKGNHIAEDIANLNEDIYTTTTTMDVFHDFSEDNTIIFNSLVNPEKQDSPFYSHKLNVIRNSIQYNLNLALSSYNVMASELDINMPVMTDDEWDKILNNISIVSFMQGFNCGMKIYNNYAIVSSSNNELTVIPNEIYYTKKNEYNTADTSHIYHRIDCPELEDAEYISFVAKEIKYDKIYDKVSQKYKYDHRNVACYKCIINTNYLKKVGTEAGADVMGYNDDILISTLSNTKQKEYYKAVAKERQNLYKTNALTNSSGYETLFTSATDSSTHITFGNGNDVQSTPGTGMRTSSLGINKIKEIELTFRNITSVNKNEATASFQATLNNSASYIPDNLVVNLEQATPQTITIPVHIEETSTLNNIKLMKTNPNDVVEFDLLNVRVIYE